MTIPQEVSSAVLQAQIAKLQEENARLAASVAAKSAPRPLTLKVSEKGAVSVYGLGRFPVTLYKQQFERLLEASENIKKFIAANQASLTVKE